MNVPRSQTNDLQQLGRQRDTDDRASSHIPRRDSAATLYDLGTSMRGARDTSAILNGRDDDFTSASYTLFGSTTAAATGSTSRYRSGRDATPRTELSTRVQERARPDTGLSPTASLLKSGVSPIAVSKYTRMYESLRANGWTSDQAAQYCSLVDQGLDAERVTERIRQRIADRRE